MGKEQHPEQPADAQGEGAAGVDQADAKAAYYVLDNSILCSKSTGIHLRQRPSILDNDLSTPLLKWGATVRGVGLDPHRRHTDTNSVKDAGLFLKDTYGRERPITEEPSEWLIVTGVLRESQRKICDVNKKWYVPFDIEHAPILLQEKGLKLEGEDEQEGTDEMLEKKLSFLPGATGDPSFEVVGTGMLYEVVHEHGVRIRCAPSMAGIPLSKAHKGSTVEMFDWDKTRTWRQVYTKQQRLGWMLLDHPEHGPLLRPKDIPFQVQPVKLMTAAVLEKSAYWLQTFIGEGMPVDVRDAGDRTPLMIAAEKQRHDHMVLLYVAGVKVDGLDCDGRSAMDMADSEMTRALLQALSGERFDLSLCQAAIDGMSKQMRDLADRLLERQKARMQLLDDITKKQPPDGQEVKLDTEARPSGSRRGKWF